MKAGVSTTKPRAVSSPTQSLNPLSTTSVSPDLERFLSHSVFIMADIIVESEAVAFHNLSGPKTCRMKPSGFVTIIVFFQMFYFFCPL